MEGLEIELKILIGLVLGAGVLTIIGLLCLGFIYIGVYGGILLFIGDVILLMGIMALSILMAFLEDVKMPES